VQAARDGTRLPWQQRVAWAYRLRAEVPDGISHRPTRPGHHQPSLIPGWRETATPGTRESPESPPGYPAFQEALGCRASGEYHVK